MRKYPIILFIGLIVCIVGLIQFTDRDLLPEVEKLLNESNEIPDEKNAYLALLGLEYDASLPPHVVGRNLLENNQSIGNKLDLNFESANGEYVCLESNKGTCNKVCCWATEEIKEAWIQNEQLIQKLKVLRTYTEYHYYDNHMTSSFTLLQALGQAGLIDAIYLFETDHDKLAIESIINTISFWRLASKAPISEINWLMIQINLARSYIILAKLWSMMPMEKFPQIEEILKPMSFETELTNLMIGELKLMNQYHKSPNYLSSMFELDLGIPQDKEISYDMKVEAFIKSAFYKPNATLNVLYTQYQDTINSLPTECPESKSLSDNQVKYYEYNPLGKIVIQNQPSSNIIQSLNRYNAYRQILRTIYEMKVEGIRPNELVNFKNNHAIASSYTGYPVYWDQDSKTFGIEMGSPECKTGIVIQEWNTTT